MRKTLVTLRGGDRTIVSAQYYRIQDGALIFRTYRGGDQYPETVQVFAAGHWLEARPYTEPNVGLPPEEVDRLGVPLRALELGIRAEHCLLNVNINTIAELVQFSANDLRRVPNLGKVTLREIEDALRRKGLQLATRDWSDPVTEGDIMDRYGVPAND